MKFFIVVLIVFGTLALFNPDERDFAAFIGEQAQTMVTDTARASSGALFGAAAGSVVGALTQALANNAFERKSYVIFSTYSLDLNGELNGEEWTFIGIGSQFFETSRPEMLDG